MTRYNEDEEFEGTASPLGFTVTPNTSHNFRVHINTDIKGPEHYARVFEMLLDAGPEDVVHFLISSPGGRADGLTNLLEGIKLTEAFVVGVIVGDASSAASILALNCHDVVVLDGAQMLCHTARTGFGGKHPDLEAYTAHSKKVTEKLLRSTYEGFLNEEELHSVIKGGELYLDADEIRARLENRAAYFTQMEEDAETQRDTDVQPPKRGSKSKKV